MSFNLIFKRRVKNDRISLVNSEKGKKGVNRIGLIRWLPPLIWMALIFYGSSRQRIQVADQFWLNFLFFKTLHLLEYGILFLLWHLPLYNRGYSSKLAAFLSIVYGISDEIHQKFVPTRTGRLRDVFIDALGVLIFWRFFLDRFLLAGRKILIYLERKKRRKVNY